MHDRFSKVKDIALGLGLAVVVSGAVVAAQVGTGAPKGRQPDRLDPCCNITAIDLNTGVITARVTKTGQVFKLDGIAATVLTKFKVGEGIEMSCALPPSSVTTGSAGSSGTTGSTGNAACGSNVPRNADTRPKDCIATSSSGAQTPSACPQNVPIKAAK